MPERPKHIKDIIVRYINVNVPHFFKYAKDKNDNQVERINRSFVNKLDGKIPNPRISYKYIKDGKSNKLAKPDCRLMMSNPEIDVKIVKGKNGQLIDGTNPVVMKYIEKSKEYWQKINAMFIQDYPREVISKTQVRKEILYNRIANEIKDELSHFGYSDFEVADILVKYLYCIKDSKYKDLLWTCYGEYLYDNLSKNKKLTTKAIQCIDCGEWFEVSVKDTMTCRCVECNIEHKRELARLRKQKQRNKS